MFHIAFSRERGIVILGIATPCMTAPQVAIKSRKYDYYNNGCLNLSKISNLHRKRYVLGWRFLVVAEKPYGIIVGENM